MASRAMLPAWEGLACCGLWTGTVRLLPERLGAPLRWRKPRRIFVCSMGDLFHAAVPPEFIAAVYGLMAAATNHTFVVLTKRPAAAQAWFSWLEQATERTEKTVGIAEQGWSRSLTLAEALFRFAGLPGNLWDLRGWPLPNAWLGVSVEDQASADHRLPVLLTIPAAVRLVSAEPLLGPVVLASQGGSERPDWVIAGAETGPNARPCHPDWLRSLRDQCGAAGVPFYLKKVNANGDRELDGRTHEETPA